MSAVPVIEEDPITTAVPAPKFEFDSEFQTKIAALCVRDTTFAQRVDGLVQPAYFENGVEAAWVSVASRYYAKYKRIPADSTVYAKLIKDDIASKLYDAAFAGLMVSHYKTVLLTTDVSDRDFVVDEVATFARHQAVSAAILESVTHLDRRDFAKIDALLRRSLDVGVNQDGDIYDYGEQLDARTQERRDRAAGKLPPTGITTGYDMINSALYHKGWGRGELSVIMGGAKAGKTTALIDFSLRAVEAGFNVLYLTLEVAARIIAERCDANISDTPVMELNGFATTVESRVQSFFSSTGGRFVVKEFPSGSATVSDIRRMVERFKSRGVIFDMVVVDYADIMAPERYSDNAQENSKNIYVNLRGMAMTEKFAVLTATQTNREGHKSSVAKAEHIAEDFNKVRIADVLISINKNDEERASGQCRLFFAASRNQPGGFSIRVEQELNKMKFVKKCVGFE